MRVIIEKNGVSAHHVSDKADFYHKKARKAELSKQINIGISNKKAREINGGQPVVKGENVPRGSPSVVSKKRVPRLAEREKYKVSEKAAKSKRTIPKNRQSELIGYAMGGAAAPKKANFSKVAGKAKKAVNLAKKPADALKRQFYSQADKSDDTGVKAVKLGLQFNEYGAKGLKTAVHTGVKTVKNGSKIVKRVYRKIHKPTSAELRRKLRKRVTHNLAAEANYLAKQAVKNGAKAAGKAAAKSAQAAAKAVKNTVIRVVGLIAQTMPYSLFIISAVILALLMAFMFTSLLSGAGGSVGGGGAWLVDDSKDQNAEDLYEGYKEFIEQADEVMQKQVKDAQKSKVTDFCNGDTDEPSKIIQYIDKTHNVTLYPASGAESEINGYIDSFGAEDYADFMSLLFVLMTREKQQTDSVTDEEVYDIDFQKSNFEEFIKSVDENSCQWGDTFVYKTATETSSEACPDEDCETEYIEDCDCGNGSCDGHPYCPENHTKLTVKIMTVRDYYGKYYAEIYNFTENEKTRYEASKSIIAGLLEYEEG